MKRVLQIPLTDASRDAAPVFETRQQRRAAERAAAKAMGRVERRKSERAAKADKLERERRKMLEG